MNRFIQSCLICFIFILSAIFPITTYADIVNIYASEDTWIESGTGANSNHGDTYGVRVANHTTSNAQGLFKFSDFSQIPSGSIINNVTTYLYCDYLQGSEYLDLYQISGNWNESTVTYSSRPGYWPNPITSQFYLSSFLNRYNDFWSNSLTDLVRGWIDGSISNYGIQIAARNNNDSNQIQFRSSENSLSYYPPYMAVNFTPERKLNVPYYNQYGSYWCAATSAAMLLKYYGISQKMWDVASNDALNWSKNEGLPGKWEFFLGTGFGNVFSDHGLTYEKRGTIGSMWANADQFIYYLKTQLSAGRPVMVASDIWLHAIVITGWDSEGENGGNFYVNDPSGAYTQRIFGSAGSLINRRIDYNQFYDSIDDIGIVITYVITSPIPANNEGLSLYPMSSGNRCDFSFFIVENPAYFFGNGFGRANISIRILLE